MVRGTGALHGDELLRKGKARVLEGGFRDTAAEPTSGPLSGSSTCAAGYGEGPARTR
ncbi:hypothetical protein GCM10027300_38470 [Modestobacter lapidis]